MFNRGGGGIDLKPSFFENRVQCATRMAGLNKQLKRLSKIIQRLFLGFPLTEDIQGRAMRDIAHFIRLNMARYAQHRSYAIFIHVTYLVCAPYTQK